MDSKNYSLVAVGVSVGAMVGSSGVASASFAFDDIAFWVGTGANEAAVVIDWNGPDGGADPVSLAWGFRWDGAATGQDMLTAVINADANLFGRFASFGFGDAIVGLGYDLDGDGFGISDGTDFGPTGRAFAGTSDGATATDGGDLYAEGWNTGFWSYTLGIGDPFDGGAWEGAQTGFGGRVLSDGELTTPLKLSVWGASKSAVEAVEKAGGSVTILKPAPAAEG